MVKLIIGEKGTGKTKRFTDMANNALKETNGSVVCVEKGSITTFHMKPQIRLINIDEYKIDNYKSFYGFLTGLIASNYDITDIFIDSIFRIVEKDELKFTDLINKINQEKCFESINLIIFVSAKKEEFEKFKKYFC